MATQLSVDEFLRLTDRELVHFVRENMTGNGDTWNISNIVDWDSVSQAKREQLSAKLL
jgi:hypothetical protein